MLQHRRTEGLRVPAFDDDYGAINKSHVGRLQDKWKLSRPRFRIRIKHKKVNVVFVVLCPRLADVFAVLPHEEYVELEVLANNRFADSAHAGEGSDGVMESWEQKLQAPASNIQ